MASISSPLVLLVLLLSILAVAFGSDDQDPIPSRWPDQFHALLYTNLTRKGGRLQITDLWYDWPRGRNMNRIQKQLGELLYDVEWGNGTSYYYTLGPGGSCRTMRFPVGILRPDFLDDATYLGRASTGGFECYVWEKVDFIWYYEDVDTRRPVRWDFFDGMTMYVITFEEGAVLEDQGWQAPSYCFTDDSSIGESKSSQIHDEILIFRNLLQLST
ncbi:uncharacterized protein At4g14100-like isoform X2 [Typha angustifolia]|uniref:uncharacterized protein At4g14100-like isoform X2 n=1 Tax=Typha angustifolia TaxID=59011 RepID=UPI003C30779F